MKQNIMRRSLASVAILLTLIFSLPYPRAAALTETPVVTVQSASVTSSAGMQDDAVVNVDGDSISVDFGTFTVPGAYAELSVILQNTGSRDAYLTKAAYTGFTDDAFSVSFPDIPDNGKEKIKAGGVCRFTVAVSLDSDYTAPALDLVDSFSMKLYYEAEELPFTPERIDPPAAATQSTPDETAAPKTTGTSSKNAASASQSGGAVQTGDVLWLLSGFFLLCAILLIAIYFWKKQYDKLVEK